MIKNLKKKVIVKDEEADEPGKASNQENENIELGQRINVEESRDSKSDMKEVEPVKDVLPAESN